MSQETINQPSIGHVNTLNSLNFKHDFPLLVRNPALIYLDNSATTQKPAAMISRLVQFYEQHNANVHRGTYRLSAYATLELEKARATVASFIAARPQEIIFTSGTTASINGLCNSLEELLNPGDEIVLTVMEHHSNLIPWQQLAKRKKLVLRFIPLTFDFRLDMQVAKKIINHKTKVVAFTHMSNVLGTINPAAELCALARAQGAISVIDAAQSIAHMPLSVRELDCDFLAFSGHKVAGPTGIGILYGKQHLLEKLNPFHVGGGMVAEVSLQNASWRELPAKFEAGTPPIAEAIALSAALEYLQKIGMAKVWEHAQELTKHGLEVFKSHPLNLRLLGPLESDDRAPIFSFVLPGVHPHDVAEILDRHNIAVRAGHHCAKPLFEELQEKSATRASFWIYNDLIDINALSAAITTVKNTFK